jgi:tetratricopeptide (TPR) repeat protein
MRPVWTRAGLVAGMILLAGASVSRAGAPPADDALTQGLKALGQTSLLKFYMEHRPATPLVKVEPGQPTALSGASGEKVTLAETEIAAAEKTKIAGERDAHFRNAAKFYKEAINDAAKAIQDTTDPVERGRLRVQNLRVRLNLANMIFQRWLKTDLDFLEVTDRRGGDRAHATELLKDCSDQFRTISSETAEVQRDADKMPEAKRKEFLNIWQFQLRNFQREADYNGAWVTYYYGWVLPADFKPAKGERSKADLLNDAITAFQPFTEMPETVSARYYALMVIGLAYRDLGEYDKALQALAQANACNTLKEEQAQPLKIRIGYERALALLRKGDFAECHKTIEGMRTFWGDKLNSSLQGVALPMVEGEAYILEGQKKDNDKTLLDKGMAEFNKIAGKGEQWALLVTGVLNDLYPDLAKNPDAQPLQIRLMAFKAFDKAVVDKKIADPKQLELAFELFKKYIAKADPKTDSNYADAAYHAGFCAQLLNLKSEAGLIYQKVATECPDYKYAPASAKYYVSLMGETYQEDRKGTDKKKIEKSRQGYEEALKWFCDKYMKSKEDLDQMYFLGMVQFDGGETKLAEAAATFGKVSDQADHYYDAQYMIPLCRLQYLRDVLMPKKDARAIVAYGLEVAKGLGDFAEKAIGWANKPGEKRKDELMRWAQLAYFNAGDVLCYSEVAQWKEALKYLTTIQEKFKDQYKLDNSTVGNVLKNLVVAYLGVGKLEDATKTLYDWMAVASQQNTQAEMREVLRAIFDAWVAEVRGLVEKKDLPGAAGKVDQAKGVGDKLNDWLQTKQPKGFEALIESNRLSLAELYLAVARFSDAKDIFEAIGGKKPWDVPRGQEVNRDVVFGLGYCYEGLADQATDPAQAVPNYETAFDIWTVILGGIDVTSRDKDQQEIWNVRYHCYYCLLKSNPQKNAQEVYDGLRGYEEIVKSGGKKLGGTDPLLQKKYDDLLSQVARMVGAEATPPAPVPAPDQQAAPPVAPAPAAPPAATPAPAASPATPAAPAKG